MHFVLHQVNFCQAVFVGSLHHWLETLQWPFRNLLCSIILSHNSLHQDRQHVLRTPLDLHQSRFPEDQ